jgi:protein-disulfide isomerase
MAQKKTSHRTAEEKAAAQAKRDARRARTERAREQAEERRKAAKRKEQLTRVGLVAGVLVLIVGGYFLITNLGGSDKPTTPPAGASGSYGVVIGEPDAPKKVVVYEDFLCPFCGQLEKTVRDRLDAAVEAGDVSVEYRPLPFLERISDYSPESANAFAVVLDAAGPDVAKAFHDLLFDNQPSEDGPFPSKDDLVDMAVEAGATEADVRPGIEDMAFQGWVDAAGEAASKAGVNSTPTVLIDGEPATGKTIDDIAAEMVGSAG